MDQSQKASESTSRARTLPTGVTSCLPCPCIPLPTEEGSGLPRPPPPSLCQNPRQPGESPRTEALGVCGGADLTGRGQLSR
jgi:hypothetical protein